jgi:outer membrane receptor protein involved in Fe transport
MNRSHTALAAALLFAAPIALAAQQPAASDSLPAYVLEGLTVTGTRTPSPRIDLPQKVDVVTRADLAESHALDVAEALKRNTALDVIEYPGLLAGVSVRGFRPQYSGIHARPLILLDGRAAGTVILATLDVSSVERIEVLKGPASSLYGSNAMGGVINVVTRHSTGALDGHVRGEYGSYQTYRGALSAGGALGGGLDFDLSLAASGRGDGYATGAHRTLGGATVKKTLPGGATETLPEGARDTTVDFTRFASRSGSLRLGYALSPGWRLDARGGFFRAHHVQNPGDLSSAFPYRTLDDLDRRTGDVSLSGRTGRNALTLRGFASRERTAYYDDADHPTFVDFRSPTRSYGAQAQDVISLGHHELVAGVDYTAAEQESQVFSAPGTAASPYSPNSGIYSAAAFAQGTAKLLDDRLVATLGGRLDRIDFSVKETPLLSGYRAGSRTNTVFNPSVGLLYHAGAGLRLHATAGRAFVTPDAFNVAGYAESRLTGRRAATITRGNPELRPESSTSWDAGIGLSRPRAGLDVDLSYFHTDVRDRIAPSQLPVEGVQLTTAGDTVVGINSFRNLDRARIRGVEGRLGYDLGARAGFAYSLRFFASATRLLRAEESSGGEERDIRNVADLTTVAGVVYDDLERFAARLAGRYVGDRVDDDFNDFEHPGSTIHYPRYLVADASASLRVGGRWRVGVAVDNLTDENYYEVRGYPMPGRTLTLSLGADLR